jgi:hypothetical protein
MIPKSGTRFSEKIMLQQIARPFDHPDRGSTDVAGLSQYDKIT